MNFDDETEQTLNALVALGRKVANRAMAAAQMYDEMQNEWINNWIDQRIEEDEEEEGDDDLRNDLWIDAQETDDYNDFCEEQYASLAKQYNVPQDAIEQAVWLMNDENGLPELEERVAAAYPYPDVAPEVLRAAIETVAALGMASFCAHQAGAYLNDQEEPDIEAVAKSYGITPAAVEAGSLIVQADALDALVKRKYEMAIAGRAATR
ncbi:hypothetical protein [Burkholderia vietnamiensis]|uniref:hypothetical protein n=1 Tax=Burkholderia vietnamiensis TaxID=60552 RepID=UPI001593BCA5|nr:hypothetical protein [Burkholderia vietnamiensis]